jgi:hypothetical protein
MYTLPANDEVRHCISKSSDSLGRTRWLGSFVNSSNVVDGGCLQLTIDAYADQAEAARQ